METPKTPAGQMTDAIMMAIREHIRPGDDTGGNVHHYNRAWEKVYALLAQVPVTKIDRDMPAVCGRVFLTGASMKICSLLRGHDGKCERPIQ